MVCPDCSRENGEQASYCIGCGGALYLSCQACAAKNALDAKYCSACGTALDGEDAQASRPSARARALCPRCGSLYEAGSQYCADCGLPLDEALANVSTPHASRRSSMPAWELGRPAGFWIRTAARIIDGLTLLAAGAILAALLFQENYFSGFLTGDGSAWRSVDTLAVLLEVAYMTVLVGALAGTVGKLLLGMRVVRTDGSRVSYRLAFARYIAQYLSLLLFGIGYLLIAFRQDKRGLHDLICDTAVVIVKT